jgi:cysteine-rich repeat protein
MRATRTSTRRRSWIGLVALGIALAASTTASLARAASSQDYPGPCFGEANATGVPLYLSADYHGANPVFGVVILNDTGRFRLGISCVATGFVVIRVGPDSALCTQLGLCTPDQLMAGLNPDVIRWVQASFPVEVPFFQECAKHGFGWYDAVGVPAGIYLAAAQSVSRFGGFVDGHGTMDTYAYVGNGGAYQPVNCPRPPVCGNFLIQPGESCDDGNTTSGDCCSSTCSVEPPGSSCGGDGDLCTPGLCDGAGFCLHQNACVDRPIDGSKLQLVRRASGEKLVWVAKHRGPSAPPGAVSFDPRIDGATLELYSPVQAPVSFALPASGWRAGAPGSGKFTFRNPGAPGGISPVRVAALKGSKGIRVVATATGFPMTSPLVGVGIRLVSGALATCSFFHAATVATDEPGRFDARGPGATSSACDRTTLAQGVPNGGVLNPGLPLPPYDPGDPSGGFCGPLELCPILEAY